MASDYDFIDEVLISARLLDRLWKYERAQGVNSTRALIEDIIEEWIQRQEAELPPPSPAANQPE